MDTTIGCTTTVTRYAYDMWNPAKAGATGTSGSDIWATLTSGGSLTMRELQGDGIDQHLAYITGSNAYWYLADHLNSIRAVLDSSGGVTASVAYDAYGNLTTAAAPGVYDWTGREFDVETGLQYNRARYYDSTTGRWISQDPMGFDAGDSNLYRYAANSPGARIDPSGLQEEQWAPRRAPLVLPPFLQPPVGQGVPNAGGNAPGMPLMPAPDFEFDPKDPTGVGRALEIRAGQLADFFDRMTPNWDFGNILPPEAAYPPPRYRPSFSLYDANKAFMARDLAGTLRGITELGPQPQTHRQLQESGVAAWNLNWAERNTKNQGSDFMITEQVQRSKAGQTPNTTQIRVYGSGPWGVFVRQAQAALAMLYNQAVASGWYPSGKLPDLASAIRYVSDRLNVFPGVGGFSGTGNIVPREVWASGRPNETLRLDIVNDKGRNLQRFRDASY